jgi:putative membrane protein
MNVDLIRCRCSALSALVLAVVFATALLAVPASAQNKGSQKFITEAIEGNFAEVAMGELAQKNGESPAVKAFGQMLVRDHSQANQKAVLAAQQIGINDPPQGPNRKQQADHAKMSQLTGSAFDKAFARHMLGDHKKDIDTYSRASKVKDAAGAYARETLPVLQKHLQTSQSLINPTAAKR